jgi:hypothetical protein
MSTREISKIFELDEADNMVVRAFTPAPEDVYFPVEINIYNSGGRGETIGASVALTRTQINELAGALNKWIADNS